MAEAVLTEGLERARRELDGATFATAWDRGRRLSADESVSEALAVEIDLATPPRQRRKVRAGARPGGLTPAEVKVLRQLASGRTTREIAENLVVATSTVDRHLTHIYTKLGVRNRAAATSFAVQQGLL
jgi:DNA-binding NarL/FixJ family response regulator